MYNVYCAMSGRTMNVQILGHSIISIYISFVLFYLKTYAVSII